MDWALGVEMVGVHRQVNFVNLAGEHLIGKTDDLMMQGLPCAQKIKRVAFEGSFSDWEVADATDYLQAFGIALQPEQENKQRVYSCKVGDLRVLVPALVLMRAFFKPVQKLIPRMFSPQNIDEVSFVNYATSPPSVVIDNNACVQIFKNIKVGARQELALEWLQSSKSARQAAQSVHRHGLHGELALNLPLGTTRIIFHGLEINGVLYANQAAQIYVAVDAEDSITERSKKFIFHSMAAPEREKTASVMNLEVPLSCLGATDITDDEWMVIEPMLTAGKNGRKVHSQRFLLDGVLWKLAKKRAWRHVPCKTGSVVNHISAFRAWKTSNRLQPVLKYLQDERAT